jgi:glucosamine kinase
VFSTAQTDPRANALVDLAVEELVLHVRALARELFGDDRAAFSVALAGGLLSRGSMLRTKLEHRLKSSVPGARIVHQDIVPARGAVRLAMHTFAVRSAAVVSS